MRITNKIMQNNTLMNINANKVSQDKLSTQMSTQKLLTRPSDDPVIAVRSLRLSTNVSETVQYYKKNVPDAQSWLKITEDALVESTDVLTNMIKDYTKGSNADLTSADRDIVLESLKALRDEIYATGNVDYAGRYVFTGYRTNTPLTFDTSTTVKYNITEQFDQSKLDDITYIDSDDLSKLTEANYADPTITTTEQDVNSSTIHRLRLSYKETDKATAPTIEYNLHEPVGGGTPVWDSVTACMTMNSYDKVAAYTDPTSGSTVTPEEPMSAYELINTPAFKDQAIYLPDTGELLLGADLYSTLKNTKDVAVTSDIDESEIRVSYDKSEWAKNDLKPEHYFACTTTIDGTNTVYNPDYLTGEMDVQRQAIEYNIGANQTIQVNITADTCFSPQIVRELDDIIKSLDNTKSMENTISTIKGLMKNTTDETKLAKLNTELDAANKAYTLLKSDLQSKFEGGITTMQGFLDDTNVQLTACGTRSQRLELVETRLSNQKTTFETLQSENEDADITEVAIQLNSAELTYQAALMATGKIAQTNLLNYL